MTSLSRTGAIRRLLFPILLVSAAPAALAQYPAGAVVQPLPRAGDPAELLAQALRTLATEPANLAALTAAGRNALVLGDPNAAVGFFGRAAEIAPRDGRIKAGLGSALVQLEKPQDALRLFAEASRLGVPDADLAEDRGLAYDLTGDPRRAQKDYLTALAATPGDDAVRRRLALSQGISGDRAAAIATLDPLIRKRDIAGWRAQTFVLAMTGDAKGAGDITHIMLPQQAAMLQPFLQRLASLSPADKARAVHFGEMPQGGAAYSPTQLATIGAPPTYASPTPTRSAPSQRSDLAPVRVASAAPRAVAPTAQTAIVTPQPSRGATPPPGASVAVSGVPAVQAGSAVATRDYGPRETGAPLAGIALTPTQPAAPATTSMLAAGSPPGAAMVPQPTVPPTTVPTQVARAEFLDAPVPPPPGSSIALPTAAVTGHYDLPHDVAPRSAARSATVRVATPKPVRTIGTPVVHGKSGETTAASDENVSVKPEKSRAAKSSKVADEGSIKTDTKADEAETKASSGRKSKTTKLAAADTADEGSGQSARSHGHGKADTQDEPRNARGARGKASAADEPSTDDGGKTPAGKGRTAKGKTTRLAAADDTGDKGTMKTGRAHGKDKADASDSDSSSSPSSKSAKAKKGKAETTPKRVYVQIAGGANRDDMDKAWSGVKKKAPELMKGKTPSTTPLRATNRLLVGPFKDEDEAQAFVNKMAGKGLSGFTFKSSKGQKVEKIDSGR